MFSSLGFGSATKFDVEVRKKERLLRKALVAYAGATSDFTGTTLLIEELLA